MLTMQRPPEAPAAAQAAPGPQQAAQIIQRRRFSTATYKHSEVPETRSHTLTAATQTPPTMDVPAFGYLRAVWMLVAIVSTGNSATVALKEDAPWSLFSDIQLQDTSTQALTQLTGFNAYVMQKYGGYGFDEDPTRSSWYSAPTTGSGATAGSAQFAVRLPVEIVNRDAFGCLLNQSQQQPFRVKYTLAPNTDVYSTAPNGTVAVNITFIVETYALPPAVVGGIQNEQAPEGHGTTQFWSQAAPAIAAAGQQALRLGRVGGMLRTVILVCRDGSGVRSNAILPPTYALSWEGRPMENEPRDFNRMKMGRAYGYPAASLDTGVYVFNYNDEFDGKPGGELRDQYLATNGASRIEITGVWAVGSVQTVVNDVYAPKAA